MEKDGKTKKNQTKHEKKEERKIEKKEKNTKKEERRNKENSATIKENAGEKYIQTQHQLNKNFSGKKNHSYTKLKADFKEAAIKHQDHQTMDLDDSDENEEEEDESEDELLENPRKKSRKLSSAPKVVKKYFDLEAKISNSSDSDEDSNSESENEETETAFSKEPQDGFEGKQNKFSLICLLHLGKEKS